MLRQLAHCSADKQAAAALASRVKLAHGLRAVVAGPSGVTGVPMTGGVKIRPPCEWQKEEPVGSAWRKDSSGMRQRHGAAAGSGGRSGGSGIKGAGVSARAQMGRCP